MVMKGARAAVAPMTVLVLVAGLAACSSPNESERYLESVSIPGYRLARTGTVYSSTIGVFVGPSPAPSASAVVGPGLRLAPEDDKIGSGSGSGEGTGDCAVSVVDRGSGDRSVRYVQESNLSGDEADALRAGALVAVEVEVRCAAQMIS